MPERGSHNRGTASMEHAIFTAAAIADRPYVRSAEPCLIGGRERASGRLVFPCPDDADRYAPVSLPRRGTIWSWTVQRFRPKSPPYAGPEAFEPYAVAYVELPGALIVEARLTGVALDAIRLGMPVETVEIVYGAAAGGSPLTTYGFAPAGNAA